MNQLLEEMERVMADLMLSGYSSGAGIAHRFRTLGDECARLGLHTGAELMETVARELEERTHTIQKEDLALTGDICRALRYVELCREKLQETDITVRWDRITGGKP